MWREKLGSTIAGYTLKKLKHLTPQEFGRNHISAPLPADDGFKRMSMDVGEGPGTMRAAGVEREGAVTRIHATPH